MFTDLLCKGPVGHYVLRDVCEMYVADLGCDGSPRE